jgi:uncharacterized phage infection (PIP) family protein YhgE
MVEPLTVDPARLQEAGNQIRGLIFPQPPAPIAATGSDAVSAAISATMPNIESLVSDGLPGVKAALTRTATSMAEAADTYKQADQSLGDGLRQFKFDAGDVLSGNAVANATGQFTQLVSGASDKLPPQVGELQSQVSAKVTELQPRVAATVPQLVQLAPYAGQAGQMASPLMSSLTSAAGQGGSSGGAAPAQLASDTKPDDQDESADAEDALDEGAAPGSHGRGSVPTQGTTGASGGRPAATTL